MAGDVERTEPQRLDEVQHAVRSHPDVAQVVEVTRRVGVAVAQLVDGEDVEFFAIGMMLAYQR